MKVFLIEAGVIVHINGVPFKLKESSKVLGTKENLKLAGLVKK